MPHNPTLPQCSPNLISAEDPKALAVGEEDESKSQRSRETYKDHANHDKFRKFGFRVECERLGFGVLGEDKLPMPTNLEVMTLDLFRSRVWGLALGLRKCQNVCFMSELSYKNPKHPKPAPKP